MKSLTRAFPATEHGGNHPDVTTLNGLNFSELESSKARGNGYIMPMTELQDE